MSPRPYNLERRRAASEQTRERILDAARGLILASATPPSIEAVAERAGVARMTVYYQFGSKAGLLEALFDNLGGPHFRSELPWVMSHADPLDALEHLIGVFFRFWSAERLVTRRIRGMAALDSDFEETIRGRDERRRQILRTLVDRTAKAHGKPASEALEETVDMLYALTSFETADNLAGEARSPDEVTPVVQRLARLVIGVGGARSDRS